MKNRYFIIFGLLMAGFLILSGCSKVDNFTAPDGSTILINPLGLTESISADTIHNFTVTVYDVEGNPLNGAEVFISGPFAAPRTIARYQFYRSTGGIDPVNSDFTGVTDSSGQYHFSIIVPATVNGSINSFSDTINFSSGSAFNSVIININLA